MEGGAEVRRLHIVYFLSHKGRIEHPHLIRVQHLSRNGVRLRDVKRWLGDLRGKEIPESFSWSYKRRYKTGYVWQDLLDDDLITPISDNEYVLKGSEISNFLDVCNKQKEQDKEQKTQENQSRSSETSVHAATKASEIEEESPTFRSETSTLTDDSTAEKNSQSSNRENDDKTTRTSALSTLFSKKTKKKSKKVSTDEEKTSPEAPAAVDSCKPPPSVPQCTKTKSNSNGASQMLRNLITCGDVDTNDSVKALNKQSKLSICSSHPGSVGSAAISKRDSFGGSQRIYGNPSWTQAQWTHRKSFDGFKESLKGELREQRTPCAPYKPANGPSCSQCGKPFKPEKMHGHMKSCKGMKAAMAKCAVKAAEKASMEFGQREAASGQLMTH